MQEGRFLASDLALALIFLDFKSALCWEASKVGTVDNKFKRSSKAGTSVSSYMRLHAIRSGANLGCLVAHLKKA